MKVEVYIRNKEIEIPCVYSNQNPYLKTVSFSINLPPAIIYKKLKDLPEKDKKALELARKLAVDGNLKIYDVCSLSGKIVAKIKGVKEFPAVFVDGKKIDFKE
ncbi:MAG: hypothetical protein QXQ69_02085 [Candidatus Aenigmatarchaeota archaeon]